MIETYKPGNGRPVAASVIRPSTAPAAWARSDPAPRVARTTAIARVVRGTCKRIHRLRERRWPRCSAQAAPRQGELLLFWGISVVRQERPNAHSPSHTSVDLRRCPRLGPEDAR